MVAEGSGSCGAAGAIEAVSAVAGTSIGAVVSAGAGAGDASLLPKANTLTLLRAEKRGSVFRLVMSILVSDLEGTFPVLLVFGRIIGRGQSRGG